MMRIISGSAKGRKLFTPPARSNEIRPTPDRAREALFSILGLRVRDALVLDLFAGTGSLGCEALSRGARSVFFVDVNKSALTLVSKNVSLIPGGPDRSTLMKRDLSRTLPFSEDEGHEQLLFDLIFADPPYRKGYAEKILYSLDNSSVLSEKVLVIVEENKAIDLDITLTKLTLDNRRCYGDTCFNFFTRR